MLLLVGVLLSCGALCLASPVPPTAGAGCAVRSLILETLTNVDKLPSEGRSELTPPNYSMEEGVNVITYLEGFIEALKNIKEHSNETLIIVNELQKIKDARKSCLKWMEQDWEPVEGEDFLQNLKNILKFLNHYAF